MWYKITKINSEGTEVESKGFDNLWQIIKAILTRKI